jgi:hypothetical protein
VLTVTAPSTTISLSTNRRSSKRGMTVSAVTILSGSLWPLLTVMTLERSGLQVVEAAEKPH